MSGYIVGKLRFQRGRSYCNSKLKTNSKETQEILYSGVVCFFSHNFGIIRLTESENYAFKEVEMNSKPEIKPKTCFFYPIFSMDFDLESKINDECIYSQNLERKALLRNL